MADRKRAGGEGLGAGMKRAEKCVIHPQPVRRAVSSVTINLPVPVSTNRLWAKNERGIHKTAAYRRWILEAGTMLELQHPGCVNGPYHIQINVRRPATKKHADLGNFEKGLSDLLQTHGVIRNDKLAESILLAWTDDAGVGGCRVTVEAEHLLPPLEGETA